MITTDNYINETIETVLPITRADRKCAAKWMQKNKNRAQLKRVLAGNDRAQKEWLIAEFTANPYANLKVEKA